jgi:hypothetical protein
VAQAYPSAKNREFFVQIVQRSDLADQGPYKPKPRPLRPDTCLSHFLDFPLEPRIPTHDRHEITNVDDPRGSVGGEKVRVGGYHNFGFKYSALDRAAIPWHTRRRLRAAVALNDSGPSKPEMQSRRMRAS